MRVNQMEDSYQERIMNMKTIKKFGSIKIKREGKLFFIAEIRRGALCGASTFWVAATMMDANYQARDFRKTDTLNDILTMYPLADQFYADQFYADQTCLKKDQESEAIAFRSL